ncbi:MAG: transposase [Flavonifractor plautii]|uniref:transposase n=1 Tax=Flavonifractor plautii TaxID=292800 RepID=UPI0012E7A725
MGNPASFLLSDGNDHDSVHSVELLEQVKISRSNILADRAYGARAIREYISERGASYVILPQKNVSHP